MSTGLGDQCTYVNTYVYVRMYVSALMILMYILYIRTVCTYVYSVRMYLYKWTCVRTYCMYIRTKPSMCTVCGFAAFNCVLVCVVCMYVSVHN